MGFKLPTVRLRHKKKKDRIITVNQDDYATDLGKHRYRNYELVGETHVSDADKKAAEAAGPSPVQIPEPDQAQITVKGDVAQETSSEQEPEATNEATKGTGSDPKNEGQDAGGEAAGQEGDDKPAAVKATRKKSGTSR